MSNPLKITELALRDAHQSLLATRVRIEDMLPIAPKLDQVGFWSSESWGGATFDACIRYLGEDPWERIRLLKQAMPNTPQQMLLRGQNLLGYRHYADDIVDAFVERAATNGVDVFRIFDALNDFRNLETAIKATLKVGKHAQGAMSYTVSPVHTIDMWVDMGKRFEDVGCHSICIKDMAGLLKPYVAEELVTRLKDSCSVPIAMQTHATTGMSTATNIKAAEAGIDMIDTAISPLSMTYGHSPTETVVAILQGTDRDPGLDLPLLAEIAEYFRGVRRKYAKFEGSLKGVDARILVSQVPGGMLTNMENQLRDQNASDSYDAVLAEIPRVRKELGYIPLVTPTSQIVGTQSVLNVLLGERYKNITKQTQAILKGEYGATPAPVDKDLQARVLGGAQPMTGRPADLIEPEMDALTTELDRLAAEKGFAVDGIDDVLTYALFPEVGVNFLKNKHDPSAFEPAPDGSAEPPKAPPAAAPARPSDQPERYTVSVDGRSYDVVVSPAGDVTGISPAASPAPQSRAAAVAGDASKRDSPKGDAVTAPLAGSIFRILVKPGQRVASGDILLIMEAMKMETEIRSAKDGTVSAVSVQEGDTVELGRALAHIA
ncbi:sodium-extruding oxaloacetate decarboxylase subunit alpha [Candidatus Rariloculus sp.]|uniref:sodium-extruding oxaloacetate decarboxylase subunit alpha n=1 Tax=Candidatus Rariloculus sp. TaxID=3101265 RepID=UPI003D0EAD9D